MTSNSIKFYRDSRRPQGWGGFFLAIWMAIYIGGAVPLWIIIVGALLTMSLVAAVIIKFRPKQLAAEWHAGHIVEQRFILPPRSHAITQAPKLYRYEDDIAALRFPVNGREHEVYVVYDEALQQQLSNSAIAVEDKRS